MGKEAGAVGGGGGRVWPFNESERAILSVSTVLLVFLVVNNKFNPGSKHYQNCK